MTSGWRTAVACAAAKIIIWEKMLPCFHGAPWTWTGATSWRPWTATVANVNPLASFAQDAKIVAASNGCVLRARGITLNSWCNVNSYVVAVRFNTKNWKYPPLPMTVDILNRRFVDNDEKEEILEKEKILTNIINVFRTKSFWWLFFIYKKSSILINYFCHFLVKKAQWESTLIEFVFKN